LQEALGEEWAAGDPRWYVALGGATAIAAVEPSLVATTTAAVARRPARTPSTAKAREIAGEKLFALEGGGATEFGREVHALLAQVEWADAAEVARLGARWNRGPAEAEALGCLSSPGLAGLWSRPEGAAEVWRERAFEIVLDGAWISGVFDRVVVRRDAGGRVTAASVYDYKTDRGAGRDPARWASQHRDQLALYRRVVAVLTGLPTHAVEAEVVLTEPAVKVALRSVE
jgi:ATP-dependent helicase/nuclease subunit A